MSRAKPPVMTLGQYLLLSMLSFRGRDTAYPSDAIVADRRLVLQWLQDRTDPETGADDEARAVLAGARFVGVEDGRVATRPSDGTLEPWAGPRS